MIAVNTEVIIGASIFTRSSRNVVGPKRLAGCPPGFHGTILWHHRWRISPRNVHGCRATPALRASRGLTPPCHRSCILGPEIYVAFTGSAARAVLGGLPLSLWWSVGLVSFSELGHSGHALVLVSSLCCQDAQGVQRGAGYNGRGRGQLADLRSETGK